MSGQSLTPAAAEPSSNEKLMAALCYPIFIVSIIILLMEEHKNKAFERYHAIQALGVTVVVMVVSIILALIPVIGCLTPLLFIPLLYWAYQAYQGKTFEVPVVTKFMRDQKWL